MHASISAAELRQTIGSETPPLVIDVRKAPAFRAARDMIDGAPRGAPQSAGLAALSLGLSRLVADDHATPAPGMVTYDALHPWCKEGKDEVHTWNPHAVR
jgi:hypothetical protein